MVSETPWNSDDLFLTSPTGSYTYGDLQKFVAHFLPSFPYINIESSQPIGLLSSSCDELVFMIAACWQLGIPFVCLNPKTPGHRLQKQLQTLTPQLIFVDQGHQHFTATVPIEKLPALEFAALSDTAPASSSDKPAFSNLEWDEQIFGYFLTSGTSGPPKIVPLKRRQMQTAARASAQNLKPAPNTFWLLCMPLNHIGGVSVILRSLLYGSAIYRMDRFNSSRVGELLSNDPRFAAASLVPTMLGRLLEDPNFSSHPGFKAILLGGGPVAPGLLEDSLKRSIPVITSYGMTETCAQIAANSVSEYVNLQSVGTVFEPNAVEIRDEEDRKLPPQQSGIIWLKGPQVFEGYQYEEEAHSFDKEGWFNTGDFGRLDEAQQLYIEARRTDRIVTGGENVSPFEVEEALQMLEYIAEAAVTALPHPEWGQQVAAVIVLKKGQKISAFKIKQQLKNRLENYKIPKKIVQTSSLPKTEIGKIKRAALSNFFE